MCVLYDRKATRYGSVAGYAVSLTLRLAVGEPLLGLPGLIPGAILVPFRTLSMLAGLATIVTVSRVSASRTARPREG